MIQKWNTKKSEKILFMDRLYHPESDRPLYRIGAYDKEERVIIVITAYNIDR